MNKFISFQMGVELPKPTGNCFFSVSQFLCAAVQNEILAEWAEMCHVGLLLSKLETGE